MQETAFSDDPGGSKLVFDTLWLFCASDTQGVCCGLAMVCVIAFVEVWVLYSAKNLQVLSAVPSFLASRMGEKCIVSRGAPENGVVSTLLHLIEKPCEGHIPLPSQHCCHPDSNIQTWTILLRILNSSTPTEPKLFPSYHISVQNHNCTLLFLFGIVRGFFPGRENTSSNLVLVFEHQAGELLAQVSDREKFWLICNKEGSRVSCVLRIKGSRQDYSWKGCLLRAQCI